VQGSSLTARHKARQYVVILAAAHVAAAAASVFLLSQLGGVVNVHLSKPSLLLIVASVAIIGAGMDAQAIRKRAFSVGLHRQTAKALAHLSTEWWVTPLLWGADTGLIWTTFRVSFCSWLLLLLTVLGGAPPWVGGVYGLAFACPLLVAVYVRRPGMGDACEISSPRWMPPQRAQLAGVVSMVALAATMLWAAYG